MNHHLQQNPLQKSYSVFNSFFFCLTLCSSMGDDGLSAGRPQVGQIWLFWSLFYFTSELYSNGTLWLLQDCLKHFLLLKNFSIQTTLFFFSFSIEYWDLRIIICYKVLFRKLTQSLNLLFFSLTQLCGTMYYVLEDPRWVLEPRWIWLALWLLLALSVGRCCYYNSFPCFTFTIKESSPKLSVLLLHDLEKNGMLGEEQSPLLPW